MKKTRTRAVVLAISQVCLFAIPLFSRPTKTSEEFQIDAGRPFVYVKFDHIGPGAPRSVYEPATRIWLRLANNCRIPIVIRANGVPDESPKEEVGLEYDVVPNRPVYPVISFSRFSRPRLPEKTKPGVVAHAKETQAETSEIPRGYIEEVAFTLVIDPGEEILFSMPVNHLSKRWHLVIPFEFDLPRGESKGLRDPKNGGIPVMVVEYTLADLPPKYQAEIPLK
ncbi:MAG TPA: hypothetical protein VJN89_06340 [Candidatus Acidoferrum sp.]|nr:hypothetical protein [Candidatus Acidoferrum sp.]